MRTHRDAHFCRLDGLKAHSSFGIERRPSYLRALRAVQWLRQRNLDVTGSLVNDSEQSVAVLHTLISRHVGRRLQLARSSATSDEALRQLHSVVNRSRLRRILLRALYGCVNPDSAAMQVDSGEACASRAKHVVCGP